MRRDDRRLDHLLDRVDQAGDRRVRTDRPALAAAGALIGHELGHLEAHIGHVADGAGGRRDGADRRERIGDRIVARLVKVGDLLPEASGVAESIAPAAAIEDDRHSRRRRGLGARLAQTRIAECDHLVEAAPDHAHVVFDHPLAQVTELLLQLCFDALEQLVLAQRLPLHQRGDLEEGPHESSTLHAIAQLGVGGLFAGDLERVNEKDLQILLFDLAPRTRRKHLPLLFRRQVALDHEHTTLAEPGQRVGVPEHVGIGRQHHVDILELGVEPDRLARQGPVERRGLAFLLRAVLGVRLDMPPQQLERGHRQILARGDGAPTADRMNADRHRALGHQVDVADRIEGELGDVRIGLEQTLLPDLQLGQPRALTHKIDPEIKRPLATAARQHVLDGRH